MSQGVVSAGGNGLGFTNHNEFLSVQPLAPPASVAGSSINSFAYNQLRNQQSK